MVRHISDEIRVMYLGQVVEAGATTRCSTAPCTRTRGPSPRRFPCPTPSSKRSGAPARQLPRPAVFAEPETGCPYNPRCPLAEEVCFMTDPPLLELEPGHFAACHVAARGAANVP